MRSELWDCCSRAMAPTNALEAHEAALLADDKQALVAPTNALEAHEAALLAGDKQALVGSSGTVAVEPRSASNTTHGLFFDFRILLRLIFFLSAASGSSLIANKTSFLRSSS